MMGSSMQNTHRVPFPLPVGGLYHRVWLQFDYFHNFIRLHDMLTHRQ